MLMLVVAIRLRRRRAREEVGFMGLVEGEIGVVLAGWGTLRRFSRGVVAGRGRVGTRNSEGESIASKYQAEQRYVSNPPR